MVLTMNYIMLRQPTASVHLEKRASAAPQVSNSCLGLQATGEAFQVLLAHPRRNQQQWGPFIGWLPQRCNGMVEQAAHAVKQCRHTWSVHRDLAASYPIVFHLERVPGDLASSGIYGRLAATPPAHLHLSSLGTQAQLCNGFGSTVNFLSFHLPLGIPSVIMCARLFLEGFQCLVWNDSPSDNLESEGQSSHGAVSTPREALGPKPSSVSCSLRQHPPQQLPKQICLADSMGCNSQVF